MARVAHAKQIKTYSRGKDMPMGKGTYGSRVGRPSKADMKDKRLKKMAMDKMKKKKRS